MIHTIHITPIHTSTSTSTSTSTTTTTSRIRLGSSSFMRLITLLFITLSITTSHVIATETYPGIPTATDLSSITHDNVTHPALPEIPSFHQLDASEYGSETLIATSHQRIIDTRDAQEYGSDVPNIHTRLEIPTQTVTETVNTSDVTETIIPSEPNPVAEVNDQYNTTYATPAPETSTHPTTQQELLPSASLAQRSPDEIAWATVVYDSASSTGSLSVVNSDTQNTTHPYVHVRGDELHGQYGASSNPILLRKTAEYEKQKAARDAAAAKHGVDPAIQQAGLDAQYGIQRPRHHHQQDHEQDASHAAVDDETNGKVSIETALIANGTWVLPNIVEKEAAKWTDAAYGSAPAEQIKAEQVVDDSPVEAILKDEATRAAAAAAAAEIVSLEALELAELADRAALEKASFQSFQDATRDAQRAADAELVDEILRENEYVRHSKQRIDKQLAREAYLREQTRQQKLHELEELVHQHRIVDGETEEFHDAADEVHGQYGTEANPDVLSKQAEEAELANQKEYTSPPIDAGTEYGDKLVITHESYETERDMIITPHIDEDEKDRQLPSEAYAIVNGSIPVPAINETEEAVYTDSEYGSSIETLSQGDHIQHIPPMERVIPKVTSYNARPNADMKHYSAQDMIIPPVDSASRAFPNVASQDETIAIATPITPEIPSVDPNRIVADPVALADVSVPRSADDMPAIKFSLADIPTLAHEAELQASISADPFTDLPNFSLAGHLDQLTRLITDSEADFMAMSVTGDGGTTAPPTVVATTAPPTDVVPGNPVGNAGLNIAPEIVNITVPAPSTARCHFSYKGLYPDTPLRRGVNTSLIASFFRIKCTPDNTKGGTVPVVQADGQASPIDVTGLDGTVSYICTAAAITPAFGQSPWSKNFPHPIQTGQMRTSLRLFVPYNETCGSPKVYHFHTQFKKQLCSAMKIMEAELTIVSCRRDYMGMTLVTIAFTFESQYKAHVHSVGHAMRTKSNVVTTPTSLSAQEKRDRLRDLILTPGSALYKDSTYTQSIDTSHWSTEQRDLGHDMCSDQGVCSNNDYCFNGHETTYQCQCDISHSTRSCFDAKQTCAPPRCLTERSLSRGYQPIADCSVYTIKIALDLHMKLDSSKSQASQASDLIAHLADVTSTAPSVFQFIGFSTNADGTARAEINVLQNGNRSTACIVKDLQYQKMDIRTPLMTAMADEMGGLDTVMKQCEDGTYAEVCDVSPRQPWYMFWIFVGMITLGTILGLTLIYLFALRACIHIFPGPMAAFAAGRHRIPGINEKKLAELQQRHALKRKQEEAAANRIYDITAMDDIGDSCVESDFHSGMSGDEHASAIHNTKTKNGQVATINNGSVRPETARTDIKPLVLPDAASVTKPKRFARWRQRSTTGNGIVPVDAQGHITDLPSPSHRMQVLDLSVAGDASPAFPVKRSWFGRKTVSQRRASFKMPEFSVSPLEDGAITPPELDCTMNQPLQTFQPTIVTRGQSVSSLFNAPSSTVTPTHRTNTPSVSQLPVSRLSSNSVSQIPSRPMGPQSTAWTAQTSVSRTSSTSISHHSQPSVSVLDPRVLAPVPRNPATSVSQALAFAQSALHEDIPTIDTTPVPVPVPVITRSSSARPTSIESARGLRRRSSSISHSMIGRVIYSSSDSDSDAIRPISTSVSRLAIPSRSGVSTTSKAPPVVIPNGYHSGMDSPAEDESSDHEYSQRSEYSHL